MARREKGSGSWDTVTKNDITYYRYRKKYDGMTSRKEFVGRTKADVKRKIQEFEAKSMRVNQKDYRKMTLGECIDNILQTLEPTFKTNNYATLQSTNRCYIKTNQHMQLFAFIEELVHYYFQETNETKVKLTTFSVVQKIFPEITFEEVTSWGVNWS